MAKQAKTQYREQLCGCEVPLLDGGTLGAAWLRSPSRARRSRAPVCGSRRAEFRPCSTAKKRRWKCSWFCPGSGKVSLATAEKSPDSGQRLFPYRCSGEVFDYKCNVRRRIYDRRRMGRVSEYGRDSAQHAPHRGWRSGACSAMELSFGPVAQLDRAAVS
jgi:hypothetical protein